MVSILAILGSGSSLIGGLPILGEFKIGRSAGSDWNVLVIVALLAIAIMMRLAAVWNRRRGQGQYQPRKLFHALCRAHKLDQAEQRLLALIAKSKQLNQPALIFVRPDLLTGEQLDEQFSAHRSQLESLRNRIFRAEK